MLDTLWYEKYRPKTLDDLVIDKTLKGKILEFKETTSIPHLLFVGGAGIGKSSLAKIIVNEILDCEYLTLNASDEGGIDTVRTKIKDFATSASLEENALKVVLLGEADGLTKQAQDSLKEIIEECATTTRFIFTANDITKLSKPIVSRCQRYDIKFSEGDFIKSCYNILRKEDITIEKEHIPDLKDLLLTCYPDFRQAIGELQKNVKEKAFVPPTHVSNSFATEVWNLILKESPEKARAHCISNPSKFTSYADLMVELAKFACKNFKLLDSRKVVLILNNFLVKDSYHINKELNFFCCAISLFNYFEDLESK